MPKRTAKKITISLLKLVGELVIAFSAGLLASHYYPLIRNLYVEIEVAGAIHKANVFLPGTLSQGTVFQVKTPSGKVRLITNAHVCGPTAIGQKLKILLPESGSEEWVKVLAVNKTIDLCLLSPLSKNDKYLELSDSDPSEGDLIFTIGFPNAHSKALVSGNLLSKGTEKLVFGPAGCDLPPVTCSVVMAEMYFTSIRSAPGASGSPVLNYSGDVIGVLFAVDTENSLYWSRIISFKTLRIFLERNDI